MCITWPTRIRHYRYRCHQSVSVSDTIANHKHCLQQLANHIYLLSSSVTDDYEITLIFFLAFQFDTISDTVATAAQFRMARLRLLFSCLIYFSRPETISYIDYYHLGLELSLIKENLSSEFDIISVVEYGGTSLGLAQLVRYFVLVSSLSLSFSQTSQTFISYISYIIYHHIY